MKKKIRNALARGGLVLWLALAPLLAGAQTIYTPDPSDTAFSKALTPVFGDVFGSGSGGALDGAVGGLFSNLNAAVLLVAAIVTAYGMVAGTMATAHDGTMLGKKWSSMWLPIRTAVGIGMILPLSGGWCAAQLMVFWLVGQSTAMAGMAWNSYAEAHIEPTERLSAPAAGNAGFLATGIFQSLVCMESLDKLVGAGGSAGSIAVPSMVTGTITASGGTRHYGTAGDPDKCGKVSFAGVASTDDLAKDIAQRMGEAQAEAVGKLERDLRPLAKAAVTDTTGALDNSATFRGAVDAYMASIDVAARDATGDGSKYADAVKAMNQRGFIYAGFREINHYTAANALASGSQAVPTLSAGSESGTSGVSADIANDQGKAAKSLQSEPSGSVSDWVSAKGQSLGEWSMGMFESARRAAAGELSISGMISRASFTYTRSILDNFKADGSNPYVSGINLGHTVMATSETVATGMTLASMGPALISPVASAVWKSTGGAILKGLVMIGYGSGTALTLLPLVPLAFWLAFVGGWILMVAEAVIAAPLWMVAHLSPEAEGLTGKGGDGYLLVTGILLRPILGLIGLALSFSVSTVLCNLLDEAYLPLLQSSAGANLIGLGSVMIMIGAYAGLKYTILIQSFRSVNVLADSVMRWIGGGEGHHGAVEASQAVAAGAEKHHSAATDGVTKGLQSLPTGIGDNQIIGGGSGGREDKVATEERQQAPSD